MSPHERRSSRCAASPVWRCTVFVVAALLVTPGCGGKTAPTPVAGTSGDDRTSPQPAVATSPSEPATAIKPRHEPYPFKRVVVFAVGINHYEKLRGSPDLRFAEADAEAFADVAEKRYGYETLLHTGQKATKREIELTLKKLGRELGNEDALIVFFAGHGQVIPLAAADEAGYLLPCDADLDLTDKSDPDRWESQALNSQHLVDLMEGMNARHVLFIADACCSGFMIPRGSLDRADLKTFLFDKSRTVIAATTKRQRAREDAAARHGMFTAALLDELRKDDAASVMDVFAPVLRSVAAKSNGTMTPQLGHVGNGDGMFVFIPKTISRSEIESDLNGRTLGDAARQGLAGVQARERQRQARRTTEGEMIEAIAAPNYRFAVLAEDEKVKWERRFERFRENAGLGDVWAMAALHVCYERGLGTEPNPEQAYHWARQLDRVLKPAGVGRYFLARCYHHGVGTTTNEAAALKLYRESAKNGYLHAELALAEHALRGKPTAEQVAEAKQALEKGVAAKIPHAAHNLAVIYASGGFPGVPPDTPRAVKLYEQAATWGSVEATFVLYEVYRAGGPGMPAKNVSRAEAHLRKSAEAGYARAQVMLARELLHKPGIGRYLGLPEDTGEALRWAKLAAEQQLPQGQMLLCDMYEHGWGVPANAEEAKKWCAAAAEQNSADAHFRRGEWYRTGQLVGRPDTREAIKHYRQASDLRHAAASYWVAKLYERLEIAGLGEHRLHTPEVLHFLTRAAKGEHPGAKKELDVSFLVRMDYGDKEEKWKAFAERYPESARDLVDLLELDPEKPWTREKRKR